jgi:glycosyltransferase involved in cell wall biosynthesis
VNLDVLLPFHRVDRFFDEAVDSLSLSQGVDFRIICIDDRIDRSENILPILKKLKHFEVVSTIGGAGYGEALKVGSQILASDTVALFNSDDLVHPLRFRAQLDQLQEFELSLCKMQKIDQRGRRINSLSGDLESHHYASLYLALGSYGANATWCMRREWWDTHAFFDNQECLDWRIALQSFEKTRISYSKNTLYYYRKHPMQVTAEKFVQAAKFFPVYKSWYSFIEKLDLPLLSEDNFRFLAMPWLSPSSCDIEAILEFGREILNKSSANGDDVFRDISGLLRRRYLFILKKSNTNSKLSKIKLASKGVTEIPSLFADVIKQARN